LLTAALLILSFARPTPRHFVTGDSARVVTVILEIRIGVVASATMSARRRGDSALLPVAGVLALAGVRPTSGLGDYMSSDSLSALLHATTAVDWDDLTATISDDGTLPVSRRAARAQRRQSLYAQPSAPAASAATSRDLPVVSPTVVIDYDVSASSTLRQLDARLGIGGDVFGGALDVDLSRAPRALIRRSAGSWQRDWPDRSWFRHLAIGRIRPTRGPAIATGILISTETSVRGREVDPVSVAGALGPGWEIEAYRDGVLIYAGLANSFGAFAVAMPAYHGSNSFIIAAHGPFEEQRTISRYVSIGDELLPARTGALDASIGRCELGACDFGANVSARYAPTTRLTAGAGVTATSITRRLQFLPSTLLAARLGDDLNAVARYSRSDASAEVRYSPSPSFDLIASYGSHLLGEQSVTGVLRQSGAILNGVWRPQSNRAISGTLAVLGRGLAGEQRLCVGSFLSIASLYLRPFASLERRAANGPVVPGYGWVAESLVPFLLPDGTRIRGTIAGATSGDRSLALTIPITRVGRIEVNAQWVTAVRVPQVTMTMSIDTRTARYQARSVTSSATSSLRHALSGSLMLSAQSHPGSRRVLFVSEQMRGRGEIAGTVFLDANTNGTRDPTEQSLSGVTILAGASAVETDSAGDYHLRDTPPFSPIVLSLDPLTLPSSGMLSQSVRVVPLPNGVTRVDFPVSVGPLRFSLDGGRTPRRLAQDSEGGHAPAIHRDDF
jgi:hypothetical protein